MEWACDAIVIVNHLVTPLLTIQHQYKEIVEWYQKLASDYSDIVTYVDSIGESIEGRDMPAVHFTKTPAPKHTIYFQCQIHASKC